jgi:hypothetical protein
MASTAVPPLPAGYKLDAGGETKLPAPPAGYKINPTPTKPVELPQPIPGHTPMERRAFLQSHPQESAAQRQEADAPFTHPQTPEGSGFVRFAQGLAGVVTGPIREVTTYISNPREWVKQYRLNTGGAAAGPDLSMLPGVSQAGQASSGDVAGAAGSALGQAGLMYGLGKFAGPRLLDEPGATAGERVSELMPGGTPADPAVALTQAIKPRAGNTQFQALLPKSLPEIKAAEADLGHPIANTGDLIEAIDIAKKKLWSSYESILGPAAQRQIDLSPVAREMESAVSRKYQMEHPAAAKSLRSIAGNYLQSFSLQDAEDFLHTANAELEAYYAKYPPGQRAALAANPQVAMIEAQARALRSAIYGDLDRETGGAAPREIKQRYGALLNLEEEAWRRKAVADRQQPISLSEQIGRWQAVGEGVLGAGKLMLGNVEGAAQIAGALAKRYAAQYLKEQQMTDRVIQRTFENYRGKPAPIDMPAPFAPRGLLTSGDRITPPPADTSYVRSAGMAPHERVNASRLELPPSSAPYSAQGTMVPDPMSDIGRRMAGYRAGLLGPGPNPPVGGPWQAGNELNRESPQVPMPDRSYVLSIPARLLNGQFLGNPDQQ